DLCEQTHHLRALQSVEVDHVGSAEHCEMGGLLAVVVQLLERHVTDLSQRSTADDLLTDLVEPQTQSIALVGRALDETFVDEDRQQAVDRALRQVHAPPELRDAEHRIGERERVEQRERPVDRGLRRLSLTCGHGRTFRVFQRYQLHSLRLSQQRRVSSAPVKYAARAARRLASVSRERSADSPTWTRRSSETG